MKLRDKLLQALRRNVEIIKDLKPYVIDMPRNPEVDTPINIFVFKAEPYQNLYEHIADRLFKRNIDFSYSMHSGKISSKSEVSRLFGIFTYKDYRSKHDVVIYHVDMPYKEYINSHELHPYQDIVGPIE